MLEDRPCLVSRGYSRTCEREDDWACMNYRIESFDVQKGKRPLETDGGEAVGVRKLPKKSDAHESGEELALTFSDISMSPTEQSGNRRHAGDYSDSSSLIHDIGRDNSISCLIRCSRSDYGSLASLNKSFHELIQTGELYRLRRKNGVVEHWVYFSCSLLEWEAFDPNRSRWMRLPIMATNECFKCLDKESLGVGTELLVFGKDLDAAKGVMGNIIYRYSLLTNTWTLGGRMNTPRCLFGSASCGEIAILAGGCDSKGRIVNAVELYNSESGTWKILPSMIKPRKNSSGVFMDGKFYVIGGTGSDGRLLTCGEEFDLKTKTWTEIPDMSPVRTVEGNNAAAPPLVAVVDNELYAADYEDMQVRKFDKDKRIWDAVGRLPERADSMNGWGLAFRACGDRLIVIGGPRNTGAGYVEINSWVPSEGPPVWNLLGRKQSNSFVYNCTVMGC
ncbi:hypothetical protein RJ640_007838 [Escallonia rubra]|uniref:Uncharacterized protein n=1 Tax=Escallonia rubra TaxID=112253 RepID=A0AA88RSA6_9ASTE|nr:hypothetical protein RJ640_007838 [Escallonia rubra]